MILKIQDVFHTFDEKKIPVLNNVSLSINRGEVIGLVGPSGAGKTTLLNTITGKVIPKSGEIKLPKNISCLSQNIDLDPSLNVFNNIASGLNSDDKNEIHQKVRELQGIFSLEYLDESSLTEVSAGQLQRIAICKSLISRPELLLLDEPFSNLDRPFKRELSDLIFDFLDEYKISCLFIGHDQELILSRCDRVAYIEDGIIHQIDTPNIIYNRPKTKNVAYFFGRSSLIISEIVKRDENYLIIKNSFGNFKIDCFSEILLNPDVGHALTLVRANQLEIVRNRGVFVEKIREDYLGDHFSIKCSIDNQIFFVNSDNPISKKKFNIAIKENTNLYCFPV